MTMMIVTRLCGNTNDSNASSLTATYDHDNNFGIFNLTKHPHNGQGKNNQVQTLHFVLEGSSQTPLITTISR